MKKSTFCEIKYMNGLFFFSKARYMIGVGFKILARTPKLPPIYPPPEIFTHLSRMECTALINWTNPFKGSWVVGLNFIQF